MLDFQEYIRNLQARGRYTFSMTELLAHADGNAVSVKRGLARLSEKRRIASVYRGFYCIVPYEYSIRGMLPFEWFVDDLFRHIGSKYYVGLLSAAAMHGAGHQQPQECHIVVPRPMRTIQVRGMRLRFFVRTGLDHAVLQQKNTPAGTIMISNPATTALDLTRFHGRVGGWNRVVEVMQELGEAIEAETMYVAATREPSLSVVQRTAYLLERAGFSDAVSQLPGLLKQKRARMILLDPSSASAGLNKNRRWMVVENMQGNTE